MTAKRNKYTLIKIFAFGIMACTLLSGLIGCQSIDKKSNNNIKIESHEIEKGRRSVERVKSDHLSSEFLELNYTGDKTYQLDVEVWIEGNLIDTWTKFSDIHLADYEGISFEIDESDESQVDVIISPYQNKSVSHVDFRMDSGVAYSISGRTESTYIKKQEFDENDEILLWGYHRFEDGFDGFDDGYEAALEMEWSLLFLLRPTDE